MECSKELRFRQVSKLNILFKITASLNLCNNILTYWSVVMEVFIVIITFILFCHLDPGMPYEVTVVAFTNAGKGVENYGHTFFTEEEAPIRSPNNVVFERSGTSVSISWEPLSLFEARGFPVYIVTLTPSSSDNHVTRQSNDGVIRVTTNESNIVVGGLDPKVEYNFTVAVVTGAGEKVTEPS